MSGAVIIGVDLSLERVRSGDTRCFCELEDGRVLVVDGRLAARLAHPDDDIDVVPAFQRLLDHSPGAFREIAVGQSRGGDARVDVSSSFTSRLSVTDRRRMREIVLKHHKFYFANRPTTAQIDQLIDSIGPTAAQKAIRRAGLN